MTTARWAGLVAGTCLALLVAGCAGDPGTQPGTLPPTSSGAPDETAGAAASRPGSERLAARCDFAMPGRTFALPGPDEETWLSAAELGSGPDVAVFLHQTGHSGLCGWLPYAEWASRQGVHAILIDVCYYGQSVCSDEASTDVAGLIGSAVEWAHAHGGRLVTLVGASMGGALAAGVGQRLGVDAIVDLSGPARWQDVPPTLRAARSITVPFLVAAADSDDGIDTTLLRRAVRVAPADVKRYVATPGGHGWSMVTQGVLLTSPAETRPTRLGRLLRDWIRGDHH